MATATVLLSSPLSLYLCLSIPSVCHASQDEATMADCIFPTGKLDDSEGDSWFLLGSMGCRRTTDANGLLDHLPGFPVLPLLLLPDPDDADVR